MTEDEWSVRFERRKKLGSGGMGTVYQVHHPGWGIDLALKIPRRDLLGRGGAAIFAQEAEAWASLESHPHVVDCYYVRLRRGFPWLVAELMEEEASWTRSATVASTRARRRSRGGSIWPSRSRTGCTTRTRTASSTRT